MKKRKLVYLEILCQLKHPSLAASHVSFQALPTLQFRLLQMLFVLHLLLLLLRVQGEAQHESELRPSIQKMDASKLCPNVIFTHPINCLTNTALLLQSKKTNDLSVVKMLMRLYAHQENAILQLETMCRINPDFASPFRNDLEFCIPQLCSFLLKGDLGYQQHDSLLNLILVASQSDFYFCHRVWFFMQANKYTEKTISSKVIHCLKQVSMH